MSRNKIYTVLGLGLLATVLVLSRSFMTNIPFMTRSMKDETQLTCPDILNNMLKGRWVPRQMTSQQEKEMDFLLDKFRKTFTLPEGFQREDLLCGNATFAKDDPSKKFKWFRALCSPKGKTPCCMQNKCQAKSVRECECDGCLDLRQTPHAEYSDWIPDNRQCQVRHFVKSEACEILDGMTLYFSGDSVMHYMFLALLLVLEGDFKRGFFKKDPPKGSDVCEGMWGFMARDCVAFMNEGNAMLCNGRVNLTFTENYHVGYAAATLHDVKDLMKKTKSLAFVGIGYHNNFDINSVKDKYLGPILDVISSHQWPKFIWSMPPAPGMLKHPTIMPQTLPGMLRFVEAMTNYLEDRDIPIFDPYTLTRNMMSFDGIHQGLGMNVEKAQIFLNYVQALRHTEKW